MVRRMMLTLLRSYPTVANWRSMEETFAAFKLGYIRRNPLFHGIQRIPTSVFNI